MTIWVSTDLWQAQRNSCTVL